MFRRDVRSAISHDIIDMDKMERGVPEAWITNPLISPRCFLWPIQNPSVGRRSKGLRFKSFGFDAAAAAQKSLPTETRLRFRDFMWNLIRQCGEIYSAASDGALR